MAEGIEVTFEGANVPARTTYEKVLVAVGRKANIERLDLDRAGLDLPAVTLAIAKKPGTNAIDMVTDLDRVLERLEGRIIPSDIEVLKTRDYGATAKEKSDELLTHLWSATLAVILLMWITLSWREATVVR